MRTDFPGFGGTQIAVTADLFNAFNWQNLGDFNTNPTDTANFGKARQVVSDPRRFQIGVEYVF